MVVLYGFWLLWCVYDWFALGVCVGFWGGMGILLIVLLL